MKHVDSFYKDADVYGNSEHSLKIHCLPGAEANGIYSSRL